MDIRKLSKINYIPHNDENYVDMIGNDGHFDLFITCKLKCSYGSSTGFFYKINNKIYIVTNRHCVYGKFYQKKILANEIIVEYNSKEQFKTCVIPNVIHIENPKIHNSPDMDVCLIETDIESDDVYYVAKNNICKNYHGYVEAKIRSFNDCDLYPDICMLSHYNNLILPIKKRGNLVQNIYDVQNTNIIYGDIKSILGNSGSPVFIETCCRYIDERRRKFIDVPKQSYIFLGINQGMGYISGCDTDKERNDYDEEGNEKKEYIKERDMISQIINGTKLLDIENVITGNVDLENENFTEQNNDYSRFDDFE